MTIKENLEIASNKLKVNNIDVPILKSRILLSFILNKPKEYLVVNQDEELTSEEEKIFENLICRLISGEPIQYITGKQEFMGMEFSVNRNVLIPRPDTEILVEEVIEIIKKTNSTRILDLCTGSGAIAISVAKNIQEIEILATDISKEAIKVARDNSIKNNTNNKVIFLESDIFSRINEKFNIIVSNPPYIEKEEIKKLDIEVQQEPILALDGGIDGLDFYRKVITESPNYLEPEGYLCLEIGYNQKENVVSLLEKSKQYKNIYSKKDLAGNDRVVACQRKK